MTRKFLQDLGLEKDIINDIMAEQGKSIESGKAENEALKAENEAFKAQLAERDKDIEELSKNNKSNDELANNYKELQEKYKEQAENHNKDIESMKKNTAIDDILKTKYGAKNVKAVKSCIDISDVELNEKGELTNFDSKVDKFVEENPYMFSKNVENKPAFSSEKSTFEGGTNTNDFKEDFRNALGLKNKE